MYTHTHTHTQRRHFNGILLCIHTQTHIYGVGKEKKVGRVGKKEGGCTSLTT